MGCYPSLPLSEHAPGARLALDVFVVRELRLAHRLRLLLPRSSSSGLETAAPTLRTSRSEQQSWPVAGARVGSTSTDNEPRDERSPPTSAKGRTQIVLRDKKLSGVAKDGHLLYFHLATLGNRVSPEGPFALVIFFFAFLTFFDFFGSFFCCFLLFFFMGKGGSSRTEPTIQDTRETEANQGHLVTEMSCSAFSANERLSENVNTLFVLSTQESLHGTGSRPTLRAVLEYACARPSISQYSATPRERKWKQRKTPPIHCAWLQRQANPRFWISQGLSGGAQGNQRAGAVRKPWRPR